MGYIPPGGSGGVHLHATSDLSDVDDLVTDDELSDAVNTKPIQPANLGDQYQAFEYNPNDSPGFMVRLTGSPAITFTALEDVSIANRRIRCNIKQDANGSRVITWPAACVNPPTLSTTANATDVIEWETWDAGITWLPTLARLNIGGTVSTTVPTAPQTVAVSAPDPTNSKEIKVTWAAPTSDGGTPILRYKVNIVSGGSVIKSAPNHTDLDNLEHSFTALTSGQTVTAYVVAVNINGDSPDSTMSGSIVVPTPGNPPSSDFPLGYVAGGQAFGGLGWASTNYPSNIPSDWDVTLHVPWSLIQPNARNSFDWTWLDQKIAKWVAAGKTRIVLRVFYGHNSPQWAKNLVGSISWKEKADGNTFTPIKWWEPLATTIMLELVAALGARYGVHANPATRIVEVYIGGNGIIYEEYSNRYMTGANAVAGTSAQQRLRNAGYTELKDRQHIIAMINGYMTHFPKNHLRMWHSEAKQGIKDGSLVGQTGLFAPDYTGSHTNAVYRSRAFVERITAYLASKGNHVALGFNNIGNNLANDNGDATHDWRDIGDPLYDVLDDYPVKAHQSAGPNFYTRFNMTVHDGLEWAIRNGAYAFEPWPGAHNQLNATDRANFVARLVANTPTDSGSPPDTIVNRVNAQFASAETSEEWVSFTQAPTVARITTDAAHGSACVQFTATAIGTSAMRGDDPNGRVAVTPGETITAVAFVKGTVVRDCTVGIQYFNSSMVALSGVTVDSAKEACSTSVWKGLHKSDVVPDGAAFATVVVKGFSLAIGNVIKVDKVAILNGTRTSTDWKMP